jgi:hypothetical protein
LKNKGSRHEPEVVWTKKGPNTQQLVNPATAQRVNAS